MKEGCLHNAVALVADGRRHLRFKHELPNYGVFDEKRVFSPGPLPEPVDVPRRPPRPADLRRHLVPDSRQRIWRSAAPSCCSSPTARPSRSEKSQQRLSLARERVSETGLPLAYVNQVGGQDELVFDGGSFVVNADGTLARQLPFWQRHRRADAMDARRRRASMRGQPTSGTSRRGSSGLQRDGARACATTCARTAFPASCSACRAASTRR